MHFLGELLQFCPNRIVERGVVDIWQRGIDIGPFSVKSYSLIRKGESSLHGDQVVLLVDSQPAGPIVLNSDHPLFDRRGADRCGRQIEQIQKVF